MDLTGTKAVVLVLLGLIKLFSGIAPLLFTRILKRRNDKFLKKFIGVVLCFGGGILLSTVLLHMLGEVRESLERATELGMIPQTLEYPFAELLVGMGFLLILLIESVVHKFFGGHGHSHFPSQETLAKTIVTSENCADGVENSGYVAESGPSGGQRERSQESNKCDVYNVSDPAYRSYSSDSDSSSMEAASKTEIQRTRSEKKILASLRSFLVVVALSIHSLFEGMAIGLEETDAGVWKLLLAVSIHAVPIVFCMGTDMISSGVKKMRIIVYMIILSINTPIGILIGILVTAHMETASGQHILVIGVLQGLAAGTLLYITFFEVLARDKLTKYGMSGLVGALAVMAGFTLMAGMESAGHSHSHGHSQAAGHHHAEGHAGHLHLPVTDPEHNHKYLHHHDQGEDSSELDHEDHKHHDEEDHDDHSHEHHDEHHHDEEEGHHDEHSHDHPDHQHDELHHDEEENHHDGHSHEHQDHYHHNDELHHDEEEDHDDHQHQHQDHQYHNEDEDHDDHEHEHHDEELEELHHDKKEDQHNIETGIKPEEYFEYNVTDYKFMHDNVAYD